MKLSSGGKSSSGRNALRERQRRDRALAPPMRVRYPQFASLRLECEFSDGAVSAPAPHVMVMHPPAPAFFLFPCPYADCDGEFDLTAAVADLAREGATQRDGQLCCAGHRTVDRSGRTPCRLTLDYSLHATVRVSAAAG